MIWDELDDKLAALDREHLRRRETEARVARGAASSLQLPRADAPMASETRRQGQAIHEGILLLVRRIEGALKA